MRLIIAGSRSLDISPIQIENFLIKNETNPFAHITEIVSGRAVGVDQSGERFARVCNIPIKSFPADWGKYGPGAGHIRNKEMAEYGDKLLLIWDGKSRGSRNMKKEMQKQIKPILEWIIK